MIDSETWRLLLQHYAIGYTEEPHAFGWGSVLSLLRAGSIQVPALCGAGFRMFGPKAAFARWDGEQAPGHALIPPDPLMRSVAHEDWDLFNGKLAVHTARLAYFHLLPHRDIMIEPFTRGIPAMEAAIARATYRLQSGLLTLLQQLTAQNAKEALTQIHAIFDATDARAGDGRRFLQGDRLTLGDLALAAAAAPVTLPAGSRSPIPRLEKMPDEYATVVREMQARPTARLVQRVYQAIK